MVYKLNFEKKLKSILYISLNFYLHFLILRKLILDLYFSNIRMPSRIGFVTSELSFTTQGHMPLIVSGPLPSIKIETILKRRHVIF